VKQKKTTTETFNLLREAYGENASSRARVFEWYKRFTEEQRMWKMTKDVAVR
jgi:hypothetical protein